MSPQEEILARLRPVNFDDMTPDQKRVYDTVIAGPRGKLQPVGSITTLLHCPELADKVQALGAYVQFNTKLPRALVELAIAIAARFWGEEREWRTHKRRALEAGVPAHIMEAIRTRQTPAFEDDAMRAVYDLATAAQVDHRVPDELYERASKALGESGLLELTAVLGYYALACMVSSVFDIPWRGDSPKELG